MKKYLLSFLFIGLAMEVMNFKVWWWSGGDEFLYLVKKMTKVNTFWQILEEKIYLTNKSIVTWQDAHKLSSDSTNDAEKLIWHPQVSLKVSIFAWRLLRDMLPTKANLVSRRILSTAAHLCVSGCGEAESAQHLFISCGTFGSLWAFMRSWIGIPVAEYTSLRDHFVQFTYSAGGSQARRSFLQLIWLACVWVVWTERNHMLFRGSTSTTHPLLDKIKLFSFRWLKATSVTLASNYHSWWSSHLLCLGLVWTIFGWLFVTRCRRGLSTLAHLVLGWLLYIYIYIWGIRWLQE
jgi:hypothetical protein